MDDIDRAQEREQTDRDAAIAAAACSAPPLPAVGQCYNCTASVPDGVRFCDADCTRDYERIKNAEVRRG